MWQNLAMSGGQGGMDFSAGPSTSEATGSAGGQAFYFEPPASVQAVQAGTVLVVGAVALAAIWFARKKG